MAHPFIEALQKRPLLCDGAMGTLLYERGASPDAGFEKLNITRQELVQQVHIDYINAGADVIQTNSFCGNKYRLEPYGLDKDVWQLNVWAAKVARNAREIAGQPVFVAGSVGPSGKLLAPIGEVSKSALEKAFQEQMEGLLAGGVDLFIIESMSSLVEMMAAVRVARRLSQLPVVAQFTFTTDGTTVMGASVPDLIKYMRQLEEQIPDVIGINCGAGPRPSLEVLHELHAAIAAAGLDNNRLFLSCQPNAGMPGRTGNQLFFVSRPDYCAGFVGPFADSGARLLGGCCGTTPEHIQAMRRELDLWIEGQSNAPLPAGGLPAQDSITSIRGYSEPVDEGTEGSLLKERETGLSSASGASKELAETAPPAEFKPAALTPGVAARLKTNDPASFFISVELDPPRGAVPRKLLQAAARMKEAGADTINVGDSPMAKVRMSSMATCLLIQQHVGIETIIHFTTRDRNLMGIQADLLGCQSLAVRNVIALTGDPPSAGHYPHATAVYDVDSIGLIRIISQLNKGMDVAGNSIGSPTNLSIACALNPTAANRKLEMERLRAKIDAGAHFVMTQPLYQISDLTDFLDDFGDCPVPIVAGIMPLNSFKHAEYLHNEVPGITIPEHIRQTMQVAGEEGARVGLELSEELIEELRFLIAGVYIVPSFGRYDDVCAMVKKLASSKCSATVSHN